MARRIGLLCAMACTIAGCGDDEDGERLVQPAGGPASGYFPVVIAEPGVAAEEVTHVRVGEHMAYGATALGDGSFQVMVQGSAEPGPADIVIDHAGGTATLAGAFSWDPPADARFERLVAIGASLSEGVQNGVPTYHGGLMSPPAQIARQLGGHFPLPLLIDPFLPEITAADIGPPPGCEAPGIVEHVTKSIFDVVPILSQGYWAARVDPDIEVHNVAVGGSKIANVLRGPFPDDFGGNFVTHLVYDPYNSGPVEKTQIEICEALEPTIVVITDLYYNDVGDALLGGDTIDPSRITPIAEARPDLEELFTRLAATGAEVFVANMPRLSIQPLTKDKRARMIAAAIAAGDDAATAEAAADAAIADADAQGAAFNQALVEVVAPYDNVHVVDVAAAVEALGAAGLDVAGQHLGIQKLGGLLGLDYVHFTDTGYALFANLFITNINQTLGTDVPLVDLESVIASDVGSPAALAAAGLDPSQCD
jgi:hypothetical protein